MSFTSTSALLRFLLMFVMLFAAFLTQFLGKADARLMQVEAEGRADFIGAMRITNRPSSHSFNSFLFIIVTVGTMRYRCQTFHMYSISVGEARKWSLSHQVVVLVKDEQPCGT